MQGVGLNAQVRVCRRYINGALALTLLMAAILKVYRLFGNSAQIDFDIIDHKAILIVMIETEFLLALWLVSGIAAKFSFYACIACFALFATIAGYEAIHAVPSCGCFGNVKVPPIITGSFDITAIIALWFTRPHKSDPPRPPLSPRRIITGISIALLASTALWTAYFLHHPLIGNRQLAIGNDPAQLVILDPADWPSKTFPLFGDIDNSAPLRHGHWIVILYHYDCESCQQAIPNYQRLAIENPTESHIAFIAMPPAAPPGQDPVADSPTYLHFALKPDHDWFATTPVVAAVADGQVIAAFDGEQAVHPPDISVWRQ